MGALPQTFWVSGALLPGGLRDAQAPLRDCYRHHRQGHGQRRVRAMMRKQQLRRQTFLVDQPFMPERIATRLIEGGLVSSPIKMPCSIAFERGGRLGAGLRHRWRADVDSGQ